MTIDTSKDTLLSTISAILVKNKRKTPVGKHDVAMWLPDIHKSTPELATLVKTYSDNKLYKLEEWINEWISKFTNEEDELTCRPLLEVLKQIALLKE